jgi:hypothetical protein
MKYWITIIVLSSFFLACRDAVPGDQNTTIQEINRLMDLQEQAWNVGDLKAFMMPYLPSDSMLFVSKNGLRFGFASTLQAYQDHYPDREKMGFLKFENAHYQFLSDHHVVVSGRWHLARSTGDIGGYYTLIWAFVDGKWFIITDHTS